MAGSSLVSYPLVDFLYPGLLGASLGCLGLQIKPKTKKITILRILGGDGGGGGGVHADPRIKLPPGVQERSFSKPLDPYHLPEWPRHVVLNGRLHTETYSMCNRHLFFISRSPPPQWQGSGGFTLYTCHVYLAIGVGVGTEVYRRLIFLVWLVTE